MGDNINIGFVNFKSLASLVDKINNELNEDVWFKWMKEDPKANLKLYGILEGINGHYSDRERELIRSLSFEEIGADFGKEITEENYTQTLELLSKLEKHWYGLIAIREKRNTKPMIYFKITPKKELEFIDHRSDVQHIHDSVRYDLLQILKKEIKLDIVGHADPIAGFGTLPRELYKGKS